MRELLDIYNAEELSLEIRIRIIKKLWPILEFQASTNIYKDIADELCDALNNRIIKKEDLAF